MIPAILLLVAAQPLHFTVVWETAEVRAGDELAARILCSTAQGVDPAMMTDAQRQLRDDLIRRIDSTWEGETWKGRLRLALALDNADRSAPRAGVTQSGCRFVFSDDTVVRTDVLQSDPSGSLAVVVEDLESGQYLAVEKLGKPSDLPELARKLFALRGTGQQDAAAREDLQRRIKEEAKRAAANMRAVAEVNGQRDLLPAGAMDNDIGAALARMWDNLDGEPRKRIERVLGILSLVRAAMNQKNAVNVDTIATGAHLPAVALRFKGVPVSETAAGARLVRTSTFREGVIGLQPPPDKVARPFFGERRWWVVDLSASFPSQVERLLRGDRP